MKTYIEQNFVDKTQIKLISEKPTGGRIVRIVKVPPQVGDAFKLAIGELAKFGPNDTVIPASSNLADYIPTPPPASIAKVTVKMADEQALAEDAPDVLPSPAGSRVTEGGAD